MEIAQDVLAQYHVDWQSMEAAPPATKFDDQPLSANALRRSSNVRRKTYLSTEDT